MGCSSWRAIALSSTSSVTSYFHIARRLRTDGPPTAWPPVVVGGCGCCVRDGGGGRSPCGITSSPRSAASAFAKTTTPASTATTAAGPVVLLIVAGRVALWHHPAGMEETLMNEISDSVSSSLNEPPVALEDSKS